MKKILSLLCVVLFLSACSKTSDPDPVVEPPLKNVYFYSDMDTNIVAFTPDGTTSTNLTSAGTNYRKIIGNPTNGVMYDENGMFYKATTDKFGKITIQQLSSSTGNTDICRFGKNGATEYLFFKKPGTDGLCATNDDVGPFAVYSGMDENSALLKPDVYPLTLISLNSNFDGWLMFANNTLSKASVDFLKLTPIATNFNSVKVISLARNHIVLDVDGQIRIYDNASGLLSGDLHAISNTGFQNGVTNDSTLFFNDGIAIYSLLLNGTLAAKALFSEAVGEVINIRAIIGELLIYTTTSDPTQHNLVTNESIHTLNVVTIASNTLVTRDTVSSVYYTNVYGSRVYFNRVGGRGEASMILTDGTGLEVVQNSVWIGETLNNFDGTKVSNQKIFLKTSLLDQANFNLISYDAMNYKISSLLTTLPKVNNIGSLYLNGTAGLGVLNENAGTSSDIFYIDIETNDSFYRITETDNKSETIIQ